MVGAGEQVSGPNTMLIRLGYDLSYHQTQFTPVILLLEVHPSRVGDLHYLDVPQTEPFVRLDRYYDAFGNRCCRLVAPPGDIRIHMETTINDSGLPDAVAPGAVQHDVQDLPYDTVQFVQGSRYCETQLLTEEAWRLFGYTSPGWSRVQAICDFVHRHLHFNYQLARSTRTAAEAYREGVGVCRDFAHLAITFCRCMNIPARYCTGYLGDIGVPPVPDPMDFSGWFEAYLGGRWYTFDARHNVPRIGRVPIAYGRDAADVAISTSFGTSRLLSFNVVTYELEPALSIAA
jgi:transglutaminase-like putative cysteine protease